MGADAARSETARDRLASFRHKARGIYLVGQRAHGTVDFSVKFLLIDLANDRFSAPEGAQEYGNVSGS
jgi:hypothetical protein